MNDDGLVVMASVVLDFDLLDRVDDGVLTDLVAFVLAIFSFWMLPQ